ncbi:unnamed protein product [Caenorhabditis nigoni]
MPIPILSLPGKDIQYALECLDIDDLIAFSLCSKRSKNLVKSSNREIHEIAAVVDENCIRFEVEVGTVQMIHELIFLDIFDAYTVKLGERVDVWRRQEFTQSDWIAHFMSIFNESTVKFLYIKTVSLSYLETVKQFIPKCQSLIIDRTCSNDLSKIVFLKFHSISNEVEIERNIFDDENDISKFLALNLKYARFAAYFTPFELKLDDLLVLNIANLSIGTVNITERELNRYLKMWMKGNQRFYPVKTLRLTLSRRMLINVQEVFKGIEYQDDDVYPFRLIRGDGKELMVFIHINQIDFSF